MNNEDAAFSLYEAWANKRSREGFEMPKRWEQLEPQERSNWSAAAIREVSMRTDRA